VARARGEKRREEKRREEKRREEADEWARPEFKISNENQILLQTWSLPNQILLQTWSLPNASFQTREKSRKIHADWFRCPGQLLLLEFPQIRNGI
jgi:hypothetical protein